MFSSLCFICSMHSERPRGYPHTRACGHVLNPNQALHTLECAHAAAALQVLVQVARLADAELMTSVVELVKTALLDMAVEGLQEQVGACTDGDGDAVHVLLAYS